MMPRKINPITSIRMDGVPCTDDAAMIVLSTEVYGVSFHTNMMLTKESLGVTQKQFDRLVEIFEMSFKAMTQELHQYIQKKLNRQENHYYGY